MPLIGALLIRTWEQILLVPFLSGGEGSIADTAATKPPTVCIHFGPRAGAVPYLGFNTLYAFTNSRTPKSMRRTAQSHDDPSMRRHQAATINVSVKIGER